MKSIRNVDVLYTIHEKSRVLEECICRVESACDTGHFESVDSALRTKPELRAALGTVPFPVSWTVKMKKKQKETQDILSYHTQAAGCSDKARAKASGGRQPIEECGRTGL